MTSHVEISQKARNMGYYLYCSMNYMSRFPFKYNT